MSTLYIVATPIGNLEDVTFRALAVLSSVDLIACEDTRVTVKLLNRYNIHVPLMSYHARSGAGKISGIVKLLESGKNVALVSDAGTPCISDPGSQLVARVRAESPDTVIVPIPGPSAVLSVLSASGLPASEFLFLGFLPHKKGREKLFSEIAECKRTVAFYESTHRIMKTLERLAALLDDGRMIVVGRELTKTFEEVKAGSAEGLLLYYTKNKEKQRSEFVVLVGPS